MQHFWGHFSYVNAAGALLFYQEGVKQHFSDKVIHTAILAVKIMSLETGSVRRRKKSSPPSALKLQNNLTESPHRHTHKKCCLLLKY